MEITIPQEVLRELEALPNKKERGITPQVEAVLVKYFGKKNAHDLADVLGVSVPTIYNWVKVLKERGKI